MARCGWRNVDGHRTYIPECWGGLYHIEGCYCPKRTSVELEEQVDALEMRVKTLEAASAAQK